MSDRCHEGMNMEVVIDARAISRTERILLVKNAIEKTFDGRIVVLTDDQNAREDISCAAQKHGWVMKGIETLGDSYKITLKPLAV